MFLVNILIPHVSLYSYSTLARASAGLGLASLRYLLQSVGCGEAKGYGCSERKKTFRGNLCLVARICTVKYLHCNVGVHPVKLTVPVLYLRAYIYIYMYDHSFRCMGTSRAVFCLVVGMIYNAEEEEEVVVVVVEEEEASGLGSERGGRSTVSTQVSTGALCLLLYWRNRRYLHNLLKVKRRSLEQGRAAAGQTYCFHKGT